MSFEKGIDYYRQGMYAEADDQFKALLQLQADHSGALYYLGVLAFKHKQYAKAEELIGRALQLDPDNAKYYCQFGLLLIEQRKFHAAIDYLRQAVTKKPDYADAYLNLSAAYFHLGDYALSIEYSRKNLQFEPTNAMAYHNIGKCLCSLNDFQGSIQNYERAVEIDPNYTHAYSSMAATYFELKNLTAVSACCMKALELDRNHAIGYLHLGMACQEQGNLEAAETFMVRAATLNPDDFVTHWNIALIMLATGRLELGWKGYEVRWMLQRALSIEMQHYPYSWWHGDAASDKTILIWWEQGIGDQIMFASLYEDALTRFKKCIISCPQKLLPLLARSFPTAQFVPREQPDQLTKYRDEIDLQIPLGSMARWLRPTVKSFPRKPYFLLPDVQRVLYWRSRLAELGTGLKIGICWRSGNVTGGRKLYCSTIGQWGEILTVPGVHFINLQYDECTEEIEQARRLFGIEINDYPEVDLFDDLDETAALTKALDLVIAIPTTSAILAAALGVPSWMLAAGFNWQQFGTDQNCWYATARHFHRSWDQSWDSVLAEVAIELQRQLTAKDDSEGAPRVRN